MFISLAHQIIGAIKSVIILAVSVEFLLKNLHLSPEDSYGGECSLDIAVSLLESVHVDALFKLFGDFLQGFLVRFSSSSRLFTFRSPAPLHFLSIADHLVETRVSFCNASTRHS